MPSFWAAVQGNRIAAVGDSARYKNKWMFQSVLLHVVRKKRRKVVQTTSEPVQLEKNSTRNIDRSQKHGCAFVPHGTGMDFI